MVSVNRFFLFTHWHKGNKKRLLLVSPHCISFNCGTWLDLHGKLQAQTPAAPAQAGLSSQHPPSPLHLSSAASSPVSEPLKGGPRPLRHVHLWRPSRPTLINGLFEWRWFNVSEHQMLCMHCHKKVFFFCFVFFTLSSFSTWCLQIWALIFVWTAEWSCEETWSLGQPQPWGNPWHAPASHYFIPLLTAGRKLAENQQATRQTQYRVHRRGDKPH